MSVVLSPQAMLFFMAAWVDEYIDSDDLPHHLLPSKSVCKNRTGGKNESKKADDQWRVQGKVEMQ